jgi:hypothetical protein
LEYQNHAKIELPSELKVYGSSILNGEYQLYKKLIYKETTNFFFALLFYSPVLFTIIFLFDDEILESFIPDVLFIPILFNNYIGDSIIGLLLTILFSLIYFFVIIIILYLIFIQIYLISDVQKKPGFFFTCLFKRFFSKEWRNLMWKIELIESHYDIKIKIRDFEKVFPGLIAFGADYELFKEFYLDELKKDALKDEKKAKQKEKERLEKEEIDKAIKEMIKVSKERNEYWLKMNGYSFEKNVALLFENKYKDVHLTPKTADGGIDIIAVDNSGEIIYIQCKNHRKPSGPAVVRELNGVMKSDNVLKGMVICSGGFTSGAIVFAKKNNIELWDINRLVDCYNKFS